jgi:hypothetical protein
MRCFMAGAQHCARQPGCPGAAVRAALHGRPRGGSGRPGAAAAAVLAAGQLRSIPGGAAAAAAHGACHSTFDTVLDPAKKAVSCCCEACLITVGHRQLVATGARTSAMQSNLHTWN